jgi:uncharacterized protein (DUF1330 family)
MPAYVLVQIDVRDAATYERYKALAGPTVTAHGGRYLVRGGRTEIMEGSWQPRRLVILEFPDAARAKAWWSSPEYSEAKAIRHGCAATEMLLAEGT